TLFKTLAITFSSMAVFTGTPLYGTSLLYAGPASMIWGWLVVTFFTWFVGIAMAEICSSFPTTGSLYFWAAYLAGPRCGPFASWCCAWLKTIGVISGNGAQAYSGSQALQIIILLSTGTNKGGGYFAVLNTFALEVIAFLDIISIWWQLSFIWNFKAVSLILRVIGGLVVIIMLPLVARPTQPASYVFTHFETSPYNYCLYGYDAAAHLTEETKGADRTGPIAILSSIGIISVFGWTYNLALTFSIKLYIHAFLAGLWSLCFTKRQWNPIFTCVEKNTPQIQGSQKCGVALYSHRHYSWTTILKLDVIFTAIISISTIGWVGGYAVSILARLLMDQKNFKPGPLYLGRARRPICLVAFLWICYTCSAFLLPTIYPIRWKTFNYAPVAPGVCLSLIMLWWVLDARKWFKGLVRNIDGQHGDT
ncbi:hypothetical protein P3X46_034894, partial [Hevea brasiliensis]